MPFKRITIFVFYITISVCAFSQSKESKVKFGNVKPEDFNVSNTKIIDSDAAAVILYEAGSTHFVGNEKGWFSYVYTCTKRIKIFNKKAFNAATVQIGCIQKMKMQKYFLMLKRLRII